jgi:hypothetical protein
MSATDHGPADSPLTREQVLDELEFLAKVEHALVVECLSVCYALGYDLGADEGGATTRQGSEAAAAASSLAQQTEMFHLDDLNNALVHANRPAQLDRAASIPGGPGPDIPLGPPGLAQLQQLAAREQAIATGVDDRYARLVPAVTSSPVFDGDLLTELQSVIVDHGSGHAAAFAAITDPLAGLTPADYLRATRRDAADGFEQRLLDASDRAYALVIAELNDQFRVAGSFSSLAVSAMRVLDDINRLLVQRGLLPPFTSP